LIEAFLVVAFAITLAASRRRSSPHLFPHHRGSAKSGAFRNGSTEHSPAGSFETSLICAGTKLLNDTHSLTHPTTLWLYWNETRWKKPFFIFKRDKMTSTVRNDGSKEPKRTSITILVLGDGEYLILSFVLAGKNELWILN
jgi:hypothetical protein